MPATPNYLETDRCQTFERQFSVWSYRGVPARLVQYCLLWSFGICFRWKFVSACGYIAQCSMMLSLCGFLAYALHLCLATAATVTSPPSFVNHRLIRPLIFTPSGFCVLVNFLFGSYFLWRIHLSKSTAN